MDRAERPGGRADRIAAQTSDAVLVSGDIAQAPTVGDHLRALHARVGRPIYFVLRNHDFYRGSIAAVRAEMDPSASGRRAGITVGSRTMHRCRGSPAGPSARSWSDRSPGIRTGA